MVRGAGRIAEIIDRMRVGETAQAGELADALPPVQLQLGRPVGEQDAPQLASAEQTVELRRRYIDQKQNQYPNLDRGEVIPTEGRSQVRQELTERMALHEPELD